MKTRYFIYSLVALFFTACNVEKGPWELSPVQEELIGQGVDFGASMADPFATRVTYRHDGSFNEGDQMTIYRQYSPDGGHSFDANTEAWRVYSLQSKRATGTDIVLETNWKPLEGKTGHNPETTDYPEGRRGDFTQTAADSLTWDNGQTVRFRAWSRSNMSNLIERSSNKDYYYPDYCVADWATVSGPTLSVPLTLKHQGSRIGFTQKAGNELYKAEICTDPADYMWVDNSDTHEHDMSSSESSKTLEEATAEANSVVAVYNKMCMPAGIDMTTSVLTTMTKAVYDARTDFRDLSDLTVVRFGTLSQDVIASTVQRPVFASNVDGRMYMVSIPYDMSSTGGETLTLPACTRFKVWLYDVNNGDKANTTGTEGNYHIFSLSDIKKSGSSDPLFPNGLELMPGYSYLFSVGYHYDHFDITPADDFSWTEEITGNDGTSTNEGATIETTRDFTWWKEAIVNAIPSSINESFNPVFHIDTKEEFLEFIGLVNGTAVTQRDGLSQVLRPKEIVNIGDEENPEYVEKDVYRWYTSDKVVNGQLRPSVNPADSMKRADAEALGYIFYQHYHPADADQAAYTREDYLRGPYNFYDENLNRHFVIHLDADLDFQDVALTTIGNTASTPFRGVFDGYDESHGKIHKLTNVNFTGGYMFGYCKQAAVKNLYIETNQNFMLMNQATAPTATGYGAYIVGISLKAPSSGNPIAGTLTGSSYVVGCIYQGHAGGAMVGTASDLFMYGNMMCATGLISGTGALLGAYADGAPTFFAPQSGTKLSWGRFHANYYDVDLSPGTNAVGNITDAYRPQEYIRGRQSWILKAINDNLLSPDVDFKDLTSEQMKNGYYGLAPWKAMNYALYEYNLVGAQVSESHNCKSHYVNETVGYAHNYPHLVYGEPNSDDDATGYKGSYGSLNLLEQNN